MAREACGIAEDDNSVIYITGGVFTPRRVSVYGPEGYKHDLPSLNHGRYNHGCAGFHKDKHPGLVIGWSVCQITVCLCRFFWLLEEGNFE